MYSIIHLNSNQFIAYTSSLCAAIVQPLPEVDSDDDGDEDEEVK